MPARLTEELREAIENEPGLAVRVIDERTNAAFVLLPEALYERLCTLLDDEEFDEADAYPHVTKLLAGNRLGNIYDDD